MFLLAFFARSWLSSEIIQQVSQDKLKIGAGILRNNGIEGEQLREKSKFDSALNQGKVSLFHSDPEEQTRARNLFINQAPTS